MNMNLQDIQQDIQRLATQQNQIQAQQMQAQQLLQAQQIANMLNQVKWYANTNRQIDRQTKHKHQHTPFDLAPEKKKTKKWKKINEILKQNSLKYTQHIYTILCSKPCHALSCFLFMFVPPPRKTKTSLKPNMLYMPKSMP